MSRGTLRVYLGAAPGVGKTYAMLAEGHRRADRGSDVVVGFVESHGRARIQALAEGLETVPRRTPVGAGTAAAELDVDAVLRRRPRVALVDELAHPNGPGSRNPRRWQDVEELLEAGIDVISTVNVEHLESMNDVVERITGVHQTDTVPDAVVRAADQVELVDMEPEALRRRLAHGNVYGPEQVDAALGHYFRVGNLIALRELALLWTADRVDEALQRYRAEHAIATTWETRERVVVALTGGPEGETLVRRAARIAARSTGGDLLAVHVSGSAGPTHASPAVLARQRRLVESLGGSYHQVLGDDVAAALLMFARAENATQLVLGASRRSRLTALLSGEGVGAATIRRSGDIDVHIVTHEESGRGRRDPQLRGSLTRRRRLVGFALAVVLPPLLALALTAPSRGLNLVSEVLLMLLVVVVVALVGGFLPALAAAVLGSLLLNYFFTAPLHTFSIEEPNNALGLLVFVVVAALVSSVVDLASRRTREAARSAAESQTLATLAGSVLRGDTALPALLDRVREAFGQSTVTLLERRPTGSAEPVAGPVAEWAVVANAGAAPCRRPESADTVVPVGADLTLALRGRPLFAADQRLLGAFAAQAATLLEHSRLSEAAAAAGTLAEANKMRTALLGAVGHDLRTPLATAKAVVTSLLGRDVDWSAEDQRDLLETANAALDRLARLVDNLLDMSRLQAGALSVLTRPTAVEEVVAMTLDALGPAGAQVLVDVPDTLPEVLADPGLLERALANVTANAIRYSPPDAPPLLTGSSLGDRVEIRVVDRGAGIPRDQYDAVFLPFQRLGDVDNSTGVGLGLALARGLVEVVGGTLTPEETPGGGLTMVISLPAASRRDDPPVEPEPGRRERVPGGPEGTP